MDKRLKELFNAELSAIGQPNIDAGDEWTEMIERVDEVRVHEGRLAALREVREMVAQRRDLHAAAGIRPEASYESCVIFELIDALIKREEEGR